MIYKKIPIAPPYPKFCSDDALQDVYLTTYILDELGFEKPRPLVLICPGGGYDHISKREGEPVALALNALGFSVAVLHYSVAPRFFPAPLFDLCASLCVIKQNASSWGVDTQKIILAGFSAGAHLALSFCCFKDLDIIKKAFPFGTYTNTPFALLLCYPVITAKKEYRHEESFCNWLGKTKKYKNLFSLENYITKDTPPCFIWHTNTDEAVDVQNSLLLAQALKKHSVSFEYHIFSNGRHGLALGTKNSSYIDGKYINLQCSCWLSLFDTWQKTLFDTQQNTIT